MAEDVKWELKDPAESMEVSSVFEGAMSLGSTLYARAPQDAMNGNAISTESSPITITLTGDENLLQDLVAIDQ